MTDSRLRQIGAGAGVVVIRDGFTVLINIDDRARAHEVWTAIGDHGTVDSIIDVLAQDGVSAMPDVVLAASEGDQLTIIVRGDVQVDVAVDVVDEPGADSGNESAASDASAGDESRRRFDGRNVRSWTETTLDRWSSCCLTLEGSASSGCDQDSIGAETFVASGVVGGGSVRWIRRDHVAPTEISTVAADQPIGHADSPAQVAAAAPVSPSTESAPDAPEVAVAAADPAPIVADEVIVDASITESALIDEAADDPYADMWGRTVFRDVQAAAVTPTDEAATRETEVVDDGPQRQADDGQVLIDSNDTRSLAEYEAGRAEPAASVTAPTVEVQAAPAEPPVEQGDHDGHTMSLAELRRLRAQTGATPEPAAPTNVEVSGPTVQAVLCSAGHPNPAYANQCRQCGQPVGGATVLVARPTLGRLQASTGDVVELDRPVIVGRNPSLTGRRLSEIPHEWRIAHGDGLSRNHAMFHIDGWQVRVEDLGSVNSTTVTLPGREPEMLRAGEPVLITDGAVIDLGGEVTCRYDASA